MTHQKTKQEHSAGGCVYKITDNQTLWLLGKHSGYHKWVLPKGMIEPGETAQATAVRETLEELAITAKIIGEDPIHTIHYTYQAIPQENNSSIRRVKTYQEDKSFPTETQKILIHKTVDFFLMKYQSGDPANHDWEMEAGGWFTLEEALSKLAFNDENHALQTAHDTLRQLTK